MLVQPAWVDDEQLTAKFAEYLTKFGPATRACPDLDADPWLVVSAMEQLLHDEMTALAASRNLAGAMRAFSDLLVWYRAWLCLPAGLPERRVARAGRRAGGVTVLSDPPLTVTVPGLGKDAYRVCELPTAQPAGPVTRELAKLVAAHVAHH